MTTFNQKHLLGQAQRLCRQMWAISNRDGRLNRRTSVSFDHRFSRRRFNRHGSGIIPTSRKLHRILDHLKSIELLPEVAQEVLRIRNTSNYK